MTKNYLQKITFFAFLLAVLSGKAQVNEVLKASQFGCITNVSFNPAIADNPFLVDINLISAGFGVENNYIGISPKTFTNHNLFNDPNFQSDYLHERVNGDPKKMFLGMQVQGPLSFMVSFGKKRNNKNAIGVSWHANSVTNVDGVGEELARSIYYGLGSKANSITGFNYQSLNNQNLSIKTLAWTDFGVTYSRVLYDEGAHMIKAGVTGKAIIGLAGGYISSNNIDYRFRNYDTLDINHSDISYGHSAAISQTQNGPPSLNDILDGKSKVSFGADLGIVYEWRPDKDKYQYDFDCQKWYQNDVKKYKLSVGFSVIDIGRVAFAKPGDVSSYTANIQGWDVKNSGINSVASFDSVLHNKGGFTATGGNSFKMWLPTRFNLYIDYNIYKGIGLNLNGVISPNFQKDNNQVHYPSSIALTPKYDMKWFGVYIPLTYNEYGNFGAGAGLRAGPLFVTSSNIITAFAYKATYAVNIQAGVKITIPYLRQKDKHKNHKLGSDIIDSICPNYTADLYKYFPNKGANPVYSSPTPNNVGAGTYVITRPNAKGGCPDSGVVIITYRTGVTAGGNKTINVCGGSTYDLTAMYPNTGYSSYVWSTPTPAAVTSGTYTLVVANATGCTDTAVAIVSANPKPNLGGNRVDSIYPGRTYDLSVLYPNIGYSTYNWVGVSNYAAVPTGTYQLMVTDKNGCSDTATATVTHKTPKPLTKKELATIKYAFDNLEFETGKDKIKQHSYLSLDGLAALLKEKGYGLRIDGHTDNVGAYEMNMDLSRRRAESVKNYLMNKGVDGSKLETNGYGFTKPIATNKTAAGRQKNRRVEMNVIYK
jgi:outer membrane protein OmpA-like peptidoglycan-associated protein